MRAALSTDVNLIMGKLIKMLTYSPAPQMKFANKDAARANVVKAIQEARAYICNGYFIMVDVGSDWYSYDRYLIEQIILKIDDRAGGVEIAIKALDELMVKFDCAACAVGDTQVGFMTPYYQAAGYVTLGTQLIKENNHRVHS